MLASAKRRCADAGDRPARRLCGADRARRRVRRRAFQRAARATVRRGSRWSAASRELSFAARAALESLPARGRSARLLGALRRRPARACRSRPTAPSTAASSGARSSRRSRRAAVADRRGRARRLRRARPDDRRLVGLRRRARCPGRCRCSLAAVAGYVVVARAVDWSRRGGSVRIRGSSCSLLPLLARRGVAGPRVARRALRARGGATPRRRASSSRCAGWRSRARFRSLLTVTAAVSFCALVTSPRCSAASLTSNSDEKAYVANGSDVQGSSIATQRCRRRFRTRRRRCSRRFDCAPRRRLDQSRCSRSIVRAFVRVLRWSWPDDPRGALRAARRARAPRCRRSRSARRAARRSIDRRRAACRSTSSRRCPRSRAWPRRAAARRPLVGCD